MKRGIIETILVLAIVGLLAWAVLTQAQATRQTAVAARAAATGQTATSIVIVLLVGVLIGALVIGGLAILYLWLRLRRETRRARRRTAGQNRRGSRRWQSGPNAYWNRVDDPALAARAPQGAGALDALVQIEVLRMVRELRGSAPPALPIAPQETAADDEDNDEIWQTWY